MGDSHLGHLVKKPKAVVFDTDNTLFFYEPAHNAALGSVRDKLMTSLNITHQEFNAVFNKAQRDVKEKLGRTASSHSRLLYFQRTVEYLGIGTKILLTLDLEQTYWRVFLMNAKLFPGVIDFILRLKSDGVIIANITDLTAQIQFRKIVYLGLDEYIDYVVTSEEAGIDKPNKVPFEIVLSKIGITDPSEIWMIGDDPVKDIEGAFKVGMIPFQKIHNGVVASDLIEDRKAFSFKSFPELLDVYCSLPCLQA